MTELDIVGHEFISYRFSVIGLIFSVRNRVVIFERNQEKERVHKNKYFIKSGYDLTVKASCVCRKEHKSTNKKKKTSLLVARQSKLSVKSQIKSQIFKKIIID